MKPRILLYDVSSDRSPTPPTPCSSFPTRQIPLFLLSDDLVKLFWTILLHLSRDNLVYTAYVGGLNTKRTPSRVQLSTAVFNPISTRFDPMVLSASHTQSNPQSRSCVRERFHSPLSLRGLPFGRVPHCWSFRFPPQTRWTSRTLETCHLRN
jgi:hypothetical protein